MDKSQMTPRQRVLAAINHQPTDQVPTDIWAVGEVVDALKKALGPDWSDKLGIDGIACPWPQYVGPALPKTAPGEAVNEWGIRNRKSLYNGGVYWEQSVYPLAQATTIDELEAYNWPAPAWYDYADVGARARQARGKQVVRVGYLALFTYHMYLRGLEQALMDPLLDAQFTHHFLNRLADTFLACHRKLLEACPWADLVEVTDDYGSQHGPIMSLEVFRTFYLPHIRRFCSLAREFGCKVFHHDDGAMSEFIPDLLEAGIDVLNPIQWPCPGMQQERLKQTYGPRLCFHGGIDNQHVMPFGSEQDVRREVRHNIDALAADRTGYILAPCHNLQAITPVANIVAMYDEAHRYGRWD